MIFCLRDDAFANYPFLESPIINLAGDYSYLSEGYYTSLEHELEGAIEPSTANCLDAYVVPIALERAKQSGIAIPEYSISNDKLLIPSLSYPINPFSNKAQLVLSQEDAKSKLNGLTRTGKYAFISQLLPEDYRIDTLRIVLGQSLTAEYDDFTMKLFSVFRLPLMRARVIVSSNSYMLSSIEALTFKELKSEERSLIEDLGSYL